MRELKYWKIQIDKIMKKTLITLALIFIYLLIYAQNQDLNLEKYWRYRERLREKFIAVSDSVEYFGANIPACEINYETSTIDWGDANMSMSHYLSVLATELWLLKNNGQDYSLTLKELYYAMLAMERLDLYSEYHIRWRDNIGHWVWTPDPDDIWSFPENGIYVWVRGYVNNLSDINGFHLRDDVNDGFWEWGQSHFGVQKYNSSFKNNLLEISQDNIYHNIEGLSLVAKLVGIESTSGIPAIFTNQIIPNKLTELGIKNGNNIDFSKWAKSFIKKYIYYMQPDGELSRKFAGIKVLKTNWFLINPVTYDLVREGSGNDFDTGLFYHHGVIEVGKKIVGENLRIYDGIVSPPDDIYNHLFQKHKADISDVFIAISTLTFLLREVLEVIINNTVLDDFDDYKLRSLSCCGNVGASDPYSILIKHRDNYSPTGTNIFPIYEHFPLIYLTLHNSKKYCNPDYYSGNNMQQDFNKESNLYTNLLNSAPTCGPTDFGNMSWRSVSRCIWPESTWNSEGKDIEYSGLDYMMLHNLYYITFRKEDYNILQIKTSSPYSSQSAYSRKIEAETSITGINMEYQASQSVTLKPGFSATGNKNFKAYISERNGYYDGTKYKLIDIDPCENYNMIVNANNNIMDDTDKAIYENKLELCNLQKLVIVEEERIAEGKIVLNNSEEHKDFESEIQISPNPNNGQFYIKISKINDNSNYSVYNNLGSLIGTGIIVNNETQIDISDQLPGIYYVKVVNGSKVINQKVIKE